MQQEWEYMEPGVDGHYPEGAWFYKDTEPTPSKYTYLGETEPHSYKRTRGTARPAHAKDRGAFIAEFYRPQKNVYFSTIEEAKLEVEVEVERRKAAGTLNI